MKKYLIIGNNLDFCNLGKRAFNTIKPVLYKRISFSTVGNIRIQNEKHRYNSRNIGE